MPVNKNATEKRFSKRRKIYVKEALRGLFFILYLISLAGLIYLCRPFGIFRTEQKNLHELKVNIRAVLPVFDNQPWEAAFTVEGRRIFPAWKTRLSPVINGPASPAAVIAENVPVKNLQGFAFKIKARDEEGDLPLYVGIDSQGRVLGVRLIRERRVFLGESLQKSDPFFMSLEGLSLESFQEGSEAALPFSAVSPQLSRTILRTVEDALRFFFSHRETFFAEANKITVPPPIDISSEINDITK